MALGRMLLRFVIVSLVIAALYFALRGARLDEFAEQITRGLALGILFSQLVSIICYAVMGLRLMMISRLPVARWVEGFDTVVSSIGLNAILPLRGAEVARPFLLVHFSRLPLSRAISVVVVERATDIVILGLMAVLVAELNYSSAIRAEIIVSILALAAVGIAILYLRGEWLVALAEVLTRPIRGSGLARFVSDSVLALVEAVRDRYFPFTFAIGVVGWLCSMLMVYTLLVFGGSLPVTLAGAALVFLMTLLGGMIAVLPAAAGTFHAAGFAGLAMLGYPPAEAAVLSIALHVQAFLFPVGYSVFQIGLGRWSISQFRSKASRTSDRPPDHEDPG